MDNKGRNMSTVNNGTIPKKSPRYIVHCPLSSVDFRLPGPILYKLWIAALTAFFTPQEEAYPWIYQRDTNP